MLVTAHEQICFINFRRRRVFLKAQFLRPHGRYCRHDPFSRLDGSSSHTFFRTLSELRVFNAFDEEDVSRIRQRLG